MLNTVPQPSESITTSYNISNGVLVRNPGQVELTFLNTTTSLIRLHFTGSAPLLNLTGHEPDGSNRAWTQNIPPSGNGIWYVITDEEPTVAGPATKVFTASNQTLRLTGTGNGTVTLSWGISAPPPPPPSPGAGGLIPAPTPEPGSPGEGIIPSLPTPTVIPAVPITPIALATLGSFLVALFTLVTILRRRVRQHRSLARTFRRSVQRSPLNLSLPIRRSDGLKWRTDRKGVRPPKAGRRKVRPPKQGRR